jgi:hypothetical protein
MGDDDATMGDIDVRRTLSELKERGLVKHVGYRYGVEISPNRFTEIMGSYIQNCLLSDIDRDFYLQVADDNSLRFYTEQYLDPFTDTEQSEDVPITTMRLVVEGRAADIVWTGIISDFTVNINV